MKCWIVCEDYTMAFIGLYLKENEAIKKAEEVGGFTLSCEIINP